MTVQFPIRVGVIGTGVMGERHARIYSDLEGCELVGVYDPDLERATAVAQRHGGTAFQLLEHLFAEVDAVSIVSPTSTHAAVAHRALDFGRHILIEKPMTATVGEARLLAERVRRSEQIVVVGHIERFNPVVQKLRSVIANDRPRRVRLRRIAPFDNRCLDSDVISDLMIHDIDLVQS
ncbi:MAG: Gfo/Idh/MocA family oxidoreductase, partial [Vicinamibacterales bacterium]